MSSAAKSPEQPVLRWQVEDRTVCDSKLNVQPVVYVVDLGEGIQDVPQEKPAENPLQRITRFYYNKASKPVAAGPAYSQPSLTKSASTTSLYKDQAKRPGERDPLAVSYMSTAASASTADRQAMYEFSRDPWQNRAHLQQHRRQHEQQPDRRPVHQQHQPPQQQRYQPLSRHQQTPPPAHQPAQVDHRQLHQRLVDEAARVRAQQRERRQMRHREGRARPQQQQQQRQRRAPPPRVPTPHHRARDAFKSPKRQMPRAAKHYV